MNIEYVNSPAGGGKTHSLIKKAADLARNGEPVLFCQPTVDLINETVANLEKDYPQLIVKRIHRENSSGPVADIIKYLFDPYQDGHVLFITQSALERINADFDRYHWHLILDEIPNITRCFDENLPEKHDIITSLISTSPGPDARYCLLTATDEEQLEAIARNEQNDAVWDKFEELSYTLLSPRWDSYVDREAYENLIDGGGSKLTVFSLLRPDIVYGFRSVTLAGACFKDSLLYRYWSKQGIGFAKTAKPNLRYNQHENGDQLTILWATEQDWSKWLAKQKDGQVLKMIEEAVLNELGQSDFLFAQNKGDDLFRGVKNALPLPNAPHGLNNFAHIHNVVFLPARNLKPSHSKFLQHMIGLTAKEIRIAIHRQVAYQTVMRGSLRDPKNDDPKRIFVPDLGTAEWLRSHFPGATLRKLETDFHKLGLPASRGRKRTYSSDAERKRASRQRQKENKIKEFNELLNHEAPNDNQLLNINFHNIGHDMSISTNSNFVTEFRGSLFENIYSKRGVICSTKTIGDFEKELENAFLNEIYDKKEDNILICPSAFDPDKVVKTDRGLANIVFADGIWLDFDGGDLSPDKLSRLFPNIRMTIYSSFSSTKASLRFRVYIPTNTTMSAIQYRAIVDAILSVIRAAGYGDKKSTGKSKTHGLDTSKRNASSLFYLPCKPKDPSGAYFKIFKRKPRKPLVVQDWIEKYIAKEEEGTFIETPLEETDIGSPEAYPFMPQEASGIVQEAVERACLEWQQCAPGKGNDEFFNLGLKLASAGCDQSETVKVLQEQAQHARSREDRLRQIQTIVEWLKENDKFKVSTNAHE